MVSRALALFATGAVVLAFMACSAGEGTCIRMSDCEAPFMCVEGTCRTDEVLGVPVASSGDGEAPVVSSDAATARGVSSADAATADATTPGATTDAATQSGTDAGAPTDAAASDQ